MHVFKSLFLSKLMKKKTKAIVLFSGGLDSRLVVKILQEQGLEIELLYFKLPFGCGCCNSVECGFNFSQTESAKLTIFDCTKGKLFEEYLEKVKNPKFGRGSGINPCIDCKIFMFKKAGEYAKKSNIKIIATGEVLGERPMSQTSNALNIISREIGFELLRPLSAKLLPETQAEKEKLVDRSKFFDIQGRNRKIQLELAKKYNIKFPNPAGGCLLCDKAYASRLTDLFSNEKIIAPELLSSIAGFRHFRAKGKIILGKNERENIALENLGKSLKWKIIISEDIPGPTAIFESKADAKIAEDLIRAYSGKDLKQREKFEGIRV